MFTLTGIPTRTTSECPRTALHFGGSSAHDARLLAEKLRMPRFFADRTTRMGFELAFSMNSLHDVGASRRSQ